ncbi:type I secretion C-terminal target domain-containing protein [Aidingimonas halophila]|uniref:type I secretion C-terminal target domain-containing protein n=1 Tax=Aidingimonas halophila TaxID=574349 RepID=UPI0036098A34
MAIDGTWSEEAGADGVGSTTVEFGGESYALDEAIDTGSGELTVNSGGTWSFVPGTNAENTGFDFELVTLDNDGDEARATHTVAVDDGAGPTPGDSDGDGKTLSLNLADTATEDGATDSTDGELAFTAGSDDITEFAFGDPANLTVDGLDGELDWTADGDGNLVGSLDGDDVLKLSLNGGPIGAQTSGTVTVTAELLDALPHDANVDELTIDGLEVIASEADGDDATGMVDMTVSDALPDATDDSADVVAGESISGNVLNNDTAVEQPTSVTGVSHESAGAVSFDNPDDVKNDGNGDYIELETDHGTLTLYQDGDYQYSANPIESTVTVPNNSLEDWQGALSGVYGFMGAPLDGQGKLDISQLTSAAEDDVKFNNGSKKGLGVDISQSGVIDDGENLVMALNGPASSAVVSIGQFNANQTETGQWQAFDSDGNLVGSGTFEGETNNGKPFSVDIDTDEPFSYLSFGLDTGSNSNQGYVVNGLSYSAYQGAAEDNFTYTMRDEDGDLDDAELNFGIDNEGDIPDPEPPVPDELLVDGNSSSSGLETAGGNDVLVGDIGGKKTNITPGQDYNVSLIVDSSGSIENQLSLLKDSLNKLAGQLVNHDGSVNLQLVSFAKNADTELTLDDITNVDNALSTIESAIADLGADGGTNYEAAFREAKEWFDGQENGYENLTYFLTDGDPTYHLNEWGDPTNDGNGSQTSQANLQNALDAFGPLSDISTVHGIGLDIYDNGNVNEDYLRYFDNTDPNGQATVDFGSTTETTLADFHGGDDPIDGEESWTVINGGGSVDRNGWGNYLELDSDGSSVTARSDSFSISEDGGSIGLQYAVDDYYQDDDFSWSLEKLSEGSWSEVENGQLNSWQSYRTIGSDLGAGDYRLVFSVEDNSWGWSDAKLELHDIELSIPDRVTGDIGQPSVIMSAEELDNVLEGGSTEEVPVDVGDDELIGGDGDDILFGDTVEHPDHEGEGFQGILDELEAQNGQAPTDDEVLTFLQDNHESLHVPADQGGDDTLDAGAGNDILYGGAGNDTLYGGAGNDDLYGGLGADTFAWELGDEGTENEPAEDTVKDFNASGEDEGDKLDLSELLQDREESDELSDFLQASQNEDGDTVLHVSTSGNLSQDGEGADQTVTLDGVSYNEDVIQNMIDEGQLKIDQ